MSEYAFITKVGVGSLDEGQIETVVNEAINRAEGRAYDEVVRLAIQSDNGVNVHMDTVIVGYDYECDMVVLRTTCIIEVK